MAKQEDGPYVEEKRADNNSFEVQTSAKGSFPHSSDTSFRKNVNTVVLIVIMILIIIAMFSFFFNMLEAIAVLINPKYQALVQALFSLLVLVIGIYTIKRLLSNKS